MKLSRKITASAFVLGLSTTLAAPAAAAFINGTEGADRLEGTAADDHMRGLRGDKIWSLGGDDDVDGGPGNDRLVLGRGADSTVPAGGNDTILGGPGRDDIQGGNGNNSMWGGPGNDELSGGDHADNYYGGGGNDRISLQRGLDWVSAGDGDDVILVYYSDPENADRDVIRCGRGFDTVRYISGHPDWSSARRQWTRPRTDPQLGHRPASRPGPEVLRATAHPRGTLGHHPAQVCPPCGRQAAVESERGKRELDTQRLDQGAEAVGQSAMPELGGV